MAEYFNPNTIEPAHIKLNKIKSMSTDEIELIINGEIKIDGQMNQPLLTSLTNELNKRIANEILNAIGKLTPK